MGGAIHGSGWLSRVALGRLALVLSVVGHGGAIAAVGARGAPVAPAEGAPAPLALLTVDIESVAAPPAPPPVVCTPPAPTAPETPAAPRRRPLPAPPATIAASPAPEPTPPAPTPAPTPAPRAPEPPAPVAAAPEPPAPGARATAALSETRAGEVAPGGAGPAASGAGAAVGGAPAAGGSQAPAPDDGGDVASYGMAVYARIVAAVQFPEQASREKIQGIVNVQILLEPDGRLRSAAVIGPSEPVLREAALDAVRRAAPFPTPPRRVAASGGPIAYEIPLRFFLKK